MNVKIKLNKEENPDPKNEHIYEGLTKCETFTGYMGTKWLYLYDEEQSLVGMYPLTEIEALIILEDK